MYLNKLNNEQKDLFLDFCVHASMANNSFAEEEKLTIDQYCVEMQIAEPRYEANFTLDEAIEKLLAISTKEELRIILLEITALIISDNEYDEMEQEFMNEFLQKAGMTVEEHSKMVAALTQLSDIYKEIDSIVHNY